MTTVSPEIDPALIEEAKRLWNEEVVNAPPPETPWLYLCAEFGPFYAYLDAHNLTITDVGLNDEIKKHIVYRYMLAAEEAWRCCFRRIAGVSVQRFLTQMARNLLAAEKTREDLGLFDDYAEDLTQHPDLEIALLNPGRLKWLPRKWDPEQQKFVVYEIAADGTIKVRGS